MYSTCYTDDCKFYTSATICAQWQQMIDVLWKPATHFFVSKQQLFYLRQQSLIFHLLRSHAPPGSTELLSDHTQSRVKIHHYRANLTICATETARIICWYIFITEMHDIVCFNLFALTSPADMSEPQNFFAIQTSWSQFHIL